MTEKYFKVDVPEGQHLGRVKGSDDDFRGLLFDGDNNLVGHAELNEIEGSGEHAGSDQADQSWEPSVEDDVIDVEELTEGLVALVELAILLAAAAAVASAPHVKRWWHEQARPTLRSAKFRALAALRQLARQSKTTSDGTSDELVAVVDHAPLDASTELIDSYQDLRTTMSSAEAQQRFVSALLAQEFANAQIRLLQGTRIEDPEDASLELERAMRSLTPGKVSEVFEELLDRNPTLIESENLAEIGRMLSSSGRALPVGLRGPDVEATLGMKIGLDRLLDRRPNLNRAACLALARPSPIDERFDRGGRGSERASEVDGFEEAERDEAADGVATNRKKIGGLGNLLQ